MKSSSIVLLMSVLLLFSSFAVRKNNSLAEWHVKGKVKGIIEHEYMLHYGAETWAGKQEYRFDEKGNLTMQRSFNSRDSIDFPDYQCSYKYDDLDNKTEEIVHNADGRVSWRTVYSYDKDGKLTVAKRYHDNGQLEEKYVYTRNDKKILVEEVSYNSTDSINNRTVYKYDAVGDETEETTYINHNRWFNRSKTTSKYDGGENLMEYIVYDTLGKVKESNKNIYNEFDQVGNWTKKTSVRYDRDDLRKLDTVIFLRKISYYQ